MSFQVPNYLSNSARAAMRFGGEVWDNLVDGMYTKPWGSAAYKGGGVGGAASWVADAVGKTVGSDEFRNKYVWPYTNPYRVVSKAVGEATKNVPLSTAAKAAVAVGTPILYHQLTETSGPLSQGMRPKGWKAAVPASKEVDPSGRTPISLPEEAAARWVLGQKSQLLPYDEFRKERPDVMPSTLANYRGYMSKKPKAGERLNIDLDKGSFTALGGAVRGTSRGLHDPEIRLKGVPISLNATLGTAAGLATVAAGKKYLDPEFTVGAVPLAWIQSKPEGWNTKPAGWQSVEGIPAKIGEKLAAAELFNARQVASKFNPKNIGQQEIPGLGSMPGTNAANYATAKENVNFWEDVVKEAGQTRAEWASKLPKAAQQFQKLENVNVAGKNFDLREPTLLAGGALAAIGTAAVARKLFQKAEERRIKKQDPVEYLKYKHGDFAKAKEAMKQPEARNWQELSQFVN